MDTMVHLLTKFQSRITTAIDAEALSIVVESVRDIPITPFMAILEDTKDVAECVWVTDVTVLTKTLTVTRGHRGTTAVAHAVDALFFHSEIDLADLGFHETWTTPAATGRPFESQLITDVLLGGWANGLKGYVNCKDTGGSVGLLSGINGEIRLPNSAGRGAYYALEGEVVLQESSRISPWGSSAGFLYLGASVAVPGDTSGLEDFDNDGRFMTVVGLTPEAGHLLSADMHTLKSAMVVAGVPRDKYLLMSIAENCISHFFAVIDDDDRIFKLGGTWATPHSTVGEGIVNITVAITGESVDQVILTSKWLNLGNGSVIVGYLTLADDGIWDGGSVLAAASISLHKYELSLRDNPAWLSIWELNMDGVDSEIDAIFNVNDPELALGYNASTATNAIGSIPFFSQAGGNIRYIMIYADP